MKAARAISSALCGASKTVLCTTTGDDAHDVSQVLLELQVTPMVLDLPLALTQPTRPCSCRAVSGKICRFIHHYTVQMCSAPCSMRS
eukprot:805829-Pelagomonas_calceolata.AAC.5